MSYHETPKVKVDYGHPLIREMYHRNPGNWEYSANIRVAPRSNSQYLIWFELSYVTRREGGGPALIRPLNAEVRYTTRVKVNERAHPLDIPDNFCQALQLVQEMTPEAIADEFAKALELVLDYGRFARKYVEVHAAEAPWFDAFLKEHQNTDSSG